MNKKTDTTKEKKAKPSAEKTDVKKVVRKFDGIVVSDKMNKTVVVRVDRTMIYPGINKRISVSRKYKAHDETDALKVGDKVTIAECRPISKDKKWRVIK